jgi:hypothetical protein
MNTLQMKLFYGWVEGAGSRAFTWRRDVLAQLLFAHAKIAFTQKCRCISVDG